MRANEFRVGNLVNCSKTDDNPCEIRIIDRYDIGVGLTDNPHGYSFDCNLEDITPIPLTEEWLLKFGFIENGSNDKTNIYDKKFEYFGIPIRVWKDGDNYTYYLSSLIKTRLTCVHQLQNLYFALTGQELEIIPEKS